MKISVFLPIFASTLLVTGYPILVSTPAQSTNATTQSVWQTFASGEGGFTVLFPGSPTPIEETLDTSMGKIDFRGLMVERAEEALYLVAYSDLPVNLNQNTEQLQSFFSDVVHNVPKLTGGKILAHERISLDSYPGKAMRIQLPDGIMARSRFYLVNQRLYQIVVITNKEQHLPGSIAGFFDSFRLTTAGVSVATLEKLNQQLNNSLCDRNWSSAVDTLNRMIASLPPSQATRENLIAYRIRIQGIANSSTVPPSDLFSSCPVSANN